MKFPLDILIQHALSSLPDSLSGRRLILGAVLDILEDEHPARKSVEAAYATLLTHEAKQKLLPLSWDSSAKKPKRIVNPPHDGHGNGGGK